MTHLLPGANEWTMTTWAMGPAGWWEGGFDGGVFQWDDGTIWITRSECATYMNEYWVDEGTAIFELAPGAIGWERLCADYGDQMRYDYSEAGNLADGWNDDRNIYAIIDGDDTMYMIGYETMWGAIYEITKSTRTWKRVAGERRDPPVGNLTFIDGWTDSGDGLTASIAPSWYDDPWLDDEFVWWWQYGPDGTPPTYPGTMILRRMSRQSPYGVETVKTFREPSSTTEPFLINPSTGLPYGLDNDVRVNGMSWGMSASIVVDGYLYLLHSNGVDTTLVTSDTWAYAGIRRIKLDSTGTTFENIVTYAAQNTISTEGGGTPQTTMSYNYPDGTRNVTGGPFPKYLGFAVAHTIKPEYRDGWIYWAGLESSANNWAYDWFSGRTWQRINLDMLLERQAEWPITWDPAAPLSEVLSNATSPERSHSRFTYTVDRISWWHDGDHPVHSIMSAGWSQTNKGSIMFSHTERGELIHSWDNAAMQVLSTLQSPIDATYDVTLVFDGSSLMGYSAISDIGSQTRDIEVALQ
jgi:hypothetical protein